MAIIWKKGGVFEEIGKAPTLSSTMVSNLSKVSKGDKVMFYDLRVKGPDGQKQLSSSLMYVVQ